jgi:hypothetical protein
MPGVSGEEKPVVPLVRLQAKATAPYCTTALSRTRYPLQVDGDQSIVVDVPRWTKTVADLDALRDPLLAAGAWFTETQRALATGAMPTPSKHLDAARFKRVATRWKELTAPLRSLYRADWFRLLLAELYPINPATVPGDTDP